MARTGQARTAPLWALAAFLAAPPGGHAEVQGYVGIQSRWFPDTPLDQRQRSASQSLVVVPEWYQQFNNGDDSINIKLFYRHDHNDPERRHGDVREAYWRHVGSGYELTVGVNTLFWGVTESRHLVDIVNQTDQVEAPDGEEKLGQAMIHLALLKDWGVLDLLVLPGFRERTFAGEAGRLRSIPVTAEEGVYASGDGDEHIDTALRWSHYVNDVSVGLSVFRGTSREPLLFLDSERGEAVLRPYYPQMQQSGLDVQYVNGDWLWKLEAIYRDYLGNKLLSRALATDYAATTFGFEKTTVDIAGSGWDLGWIAEYSYDSRPASVAPFDDDLFLGARLSLNDIAGSELLMGVSQDLTVNDAHLAVVEGSTRVGTATRISLELNYFHSNSPEDALFPLRQDSFVELGIDYYF